jgi:hypothetical protein
MSQTAKKETVFFRTEEGRLHPKKIRPNDHPRQDRIAARADIFSGPSQAFEASRRARARAAR